MLSRYPFLRVLMLVAALVVAAPTVAACGDDKAENYDAEGEKVVDQFQKDVQAAQQNVQSQQDPESIAGALGQMKTAFDKAADGLSELDPPEDAKATHDEFVAQLRGFGPEIDKLSEAVRSQDAEAAQEVQTSFQTKLTELQTTGEELKKQLND